METLPYWRLWGFLRCVVRLSLLIKKKTRFYLIVGASEGLSMVSLLVEASVVIFFAISAGLCCVKSVVASCIRDVSVVASCIRGVSAVVSCIRIVSSVASCIKIVSAEVLSAIEDSFCSSSESFLKRSYSKMQDARQMISMSRLGLLKIL